MNAERRPTATRQNLTLLQRRLERVAKGAGLLRRKREALVAELFRLARPAATARVTIHDRAARAYPALLRALAHEGADGLRALGWPSRDLRIEIRSSQVWGIAVSEILAQPSIRRTAEARGVPPATESGAADEATTAFEELAELLLDAANRETLLRRLGEAVARTSRQVNTLERRLQPALRTALTTVRRTLDEREREEHLRLARLLRSHQAGDPAARSGEP
ncbi:MAG TPA: V-type ATP synthase subunit D [Gemmatimonadales bacterium]|jgi:V/A-type H+-transporting ATPase subunit D